MKLKLQSQNFLCFLFADVLASVDVSNSLLGRMVRFALGQKLEMILKVTQLRELSNRMMALQIMGC